MIGDIKAAIEYIISNVSLRDFVVDHEDIELKDSGKHLKGLCPFHPETSPSFTISEFDGVERYYCFGCHRKGNILNYVQEKYMMDFGEAIDFLAQKYSLDLSKYERELTDEESKLHDRFAVMKVVAGWCQDKLLGERGKPYEYMVQQRGLKETVLEKFMVGYSSSVIDLAHFLSSENLRCDLSDMEFTDTRLWTDSLVFPVFDTRGFINRFYFRPFKPAIGQKYIATSHKHPLFSRTDSVFGLYQCKRSSKRIQDGIIAVEGQIDCLSFHQYDYDNTIGLCGLNVDSLLIDRLRKFNIETLTTIYDGDQAGRDAATRLSFSDVNAKDIDIKISYIPVDGIDPADYIRNYKDANVFINDGAKSSTIFAVDSVSTKYNLSDSLDYVSFIKEVSRLIKQYRHLETRIVVRRVAELLNLSDDIILDYLYLYGGDDIFTNTKAEDAILRQMIEESTPVILGEVINLVDVNDFSINVNKYIYLKICERSAGDKVISYDWIKKQAIIDEYDGVLRHIDEHIRSAKIMEYTWCIEEIVDKARRRRTADLAHHMAGRVTDLKIPVVEIIEDLSAQISTLVYASDSKGAMTMEGMVDEAVELYNVRRDLKTEILGFPFGERFPRTNDLIPGLELGKALLISASTGVGKTNLGLNFTCDWTLSPLEGFDPTKVLYLPFEMSPQQLRFRLWAIHSGVGARKIERGLPLTEEEQYRLHLTMELDKKYGPIIRKPRQSTITAALHEINYWKAKADIKIVVLDFVQRAMRCDLTGHNISDTQLYQMVARIFVDRATSREDIAVVLLSQQSDEAKKAGVEAEGGLSWSKHILDDFDYHIIVMRKDMKQIQKYGAQYGNRFYKIEKNRFSLENQVFHAHLFNHIDRENGIYGNLRFAETQWLIDTDTQKDIKISGLEK